jgi:hypothetical protein
MLKQKGKMFDGKMFDGKMFGGKMFGGRNLLLLLIFILLFRTFYKIILYTTTNFSKKITIKDKYTRIRRKSSSNFYMVVDTDNNIYSVDNLWFKNDFNRANDWASLNKGDTHIIHGYGIRFAMLDLYQVIYQVE